MIASQKKEKSAQKVIKNEVSSNNQMNQQIIPPTWQQFQKLRELVKGAKKICFHEDDDRMEGGMKGVYEGRIEPIAIVAFPPQRHQNPMVVVAEYDNSSPVLEKDYPYLIWCIHLTENYEFRLYDPVSKKIGWLFCRPTIDGSVEGMKSVPYLKCSDCTIFRF